MTRSSVTITLKGKLFVKNLEGISMTRMNNNEPKIDP